MDSSQRENGDFIEKEETTDSILVTSELSHFKEKSETASLLSRLPQIYADPIESEAVTQKFLVIMNGYQEMPHLLDPHLEWILNTLLDFIRKEVPEPSLVHLSFKFLYIVCKVRGYKIFMQLFPHEVCDLIPVLEMISSQDPSDLNTWETRYMLLLWLSMTCLIPFDLSRLDGHLELEDGKRREPIMNRVLEIAKSYLVVSDSPRDAASVLVSKFMTRPDVKQKCLREFLDWTLALISECRDDSISSLHVLNGALQCLAQLFKHGKRNDLLPYAPTVLRCLEQKRLSGSSEAILRKLNVKLVQRLGLNFLKPRLAAWRYQRGSRSLAANLAKSTPTPTVPAPLPEEETLKGDENYDIPEEVETVIEHLLEGLKDEETVVRWSAAKGIGRVTGRLPKELADEVVGSVLDCFSFQESDKAWHGGCLALAELGRRGLLLPSRLTDVVPLIVKALTYEERRGACSVGSNVRDSACYVCWSFARAYEPKELQPFVDQIASALLITSVFDRNINCRRAASAAFQENVGRQGTFPHGIVILTAADYQAVGNITHCYLNISVHIASFPEYTKAMIDHLVAVRLHHWDGEIRELATKALHNLTPQAPDYMATTVLTQILSMATGKDLMGRHGAILACGEIVHALHKESLQSNRNVADMISHESVDALKEIHQTLNDRKQYKGFGGLLMRPAICGLIEKLSLSKMPFKNDPIIAGWQWIIDDTIQTLHLFSSGGTNKMIVAVVSALSALCLEFYQDASGHADPHMQDVLVSRYIEGLTSQHTLTRSGSALALGALPKALIHGKLDQIFAGLRQMCDVSQKEGNFTEARRDAVKAIAQVCVKAGVCADGPADSVLCWENIGPVFDVLLSGLNDYTSDSRGDVGAWVREAAMSSLMEVTFLVSSGAPEMLTPNLVEPVMCCLAQQAAGKIDRYRENAGRIFLRLVHSTDPAVPHIPHQEELLLIFPAKTLSSLNWNAPSEAFRYITQLLGLAKYQYHTLLGLSMSAGGITESTVRFSSQSLFDFLKGIQNDEVALAQFGNTLLSILKDNLNNDRVCVPLLKMLNQMLANGCFDIFTKRENHQFCTDLLACCVNFRRTKSISKLRACIDVFCGLIQFRGDVRKNVLSHLLLLLCHPYPIIRKSVASQIYEMFLTYEDVVDSDVLDDVMTLLSDTNWEVDVQILKIPRNQLYDWLEIPRPQLVAKKAAEV